MKVFLSFSPSPHQPPNPHSLATCTLSLGTTWMIFSCMESRGSPWNVTPALTFCRLLLLACSLMAWIPVTTNKSTPRLKQTLPTYPEEPSHDTRCFQDQRGTAINLLNQMYHGVWTWTNCCLVGFENTFSMLFCLYSFKYTVYSYSKTNGLNWKQRRGTWISEWSP